MSTYFSRENPQDLNRYYSPDILIVGGGMAGISAAVAAARLGAKTLLVHNRPVLGGPAGTECECESIGALIVGGTNWTTRDARETGPIEDFRMTTEYLYENGWRNHLSQVLRDVAEKEENLTLLLNTEAYDVKVEDGKITEILARTLNSDLTNYIKPKMVLDCSGDSFVSVKAGAQYRHGREAKSEFNETLAPDEADSCTLGSSLYFRAIDTGHPVPFKAPEWAEKFTDEMLGPGRTHKDPRKGFWWIECGGEMDTICDNEVIYKKLLGIVYGVWDHIKNHGDHNAENYAIEWISSIPAKRESRRIMGDYILTEGDVVAHAVYPDGVAYSGGNLDIHPLKGIFSGNHPCGPQHGIMSPGLYQIPLRCLYVPEVKNLMMAGRNISVTHAALSSTRLMGTCALCGQAAAATAVLCCKYGETPRDISESRMKELLRILYRVDHTLPDVVVDDPDNLCRNADVKVSSSMGLSLLDMECAGTEALGTGEAPAAQSFIATTQEIREAAFLMNHNGSEPAEVCAELVLQEEMYDFSKGTVLAESKVQVAPGKAQKVLFRFNAAVEYGKRYYIRLSGPASVESCLNKRYLPGIWRSNLPISWPPQGDNTNHSFNLIPEQRPFEGENIIKSENRGGDALSIWISDPKAAFPQTAQVTFPEKKTVSCVELVFDTSLEHINIYSSQQECVKEYVLEGICGDKTIVLAEEKDNYLRFRKHVFPPVELSALRLTVRSTRGDASARVYQIRAYEKAEIS
ncbi:MAG: FAD-dependent oxidoreductase [Lentisphaeria bacterium]|nr:FAD-dependent oxidoreductase [Lentisphaeria bacterium]